MQWTYDEIHTHAVRACHFVDDTRKHKLAPCFDEHELMNDHLQLPERDERFENEWIGVGGCVVVGLEV